MDERQAARILGLSVATLQAWRYQKRGPRYVKLGNAVRYREADLRAWIESQLVEPLAEGARA